jgi:uracil-DNA glycosylase family protein
VVTRPAHTLSVVAEEAASCTRCDLYARATQTVFGEGPVPAPLMLVGEQPGDQEDRKGHVFVGPAGRILDEALETAGLSRSDVYVTNAVKHFKWEPRGKRRIHKKPNATEMAACAHWLDQEVEMVAPDALLALGATAVQALFDRKATVGALRGGTHVSRVEVPTIVTVHPASIVRLQERDERHAQLAAFVGDIRRAAEVAGISPAGSPGDGAGR